MRWSKHILDALGDKFTVGEGCWLWTGATDEDGYGFLTRRLPQRTTVRAHRALYELLVGPIPDGLVLDHLCRTPSVVLTDGHRSCVRPDHLERGLSNEPWPYCKRGHRLDDENIYIWRGRRKQCAICMRAVSLARYHRRKGDFDRADEIMERLEVRA